MNKNRGVMYLMISRTFLVLCAVLLACGAGVYFTLTFADAIDGQINQGKIERDHLMKMMRTEQSNFNAAKQLRGGN